MSASLQNGKKKDDFPPMQFAMFLIVFFGMLLAPWLFRLLH